MKKVELLAPAGNFDCLKAAINNGADAVYLGGKNFSARAFANNFDNEELKEAIRYAHLRNVKIYVTLNTLLNEFEIDNAVKMADFYYENDVDGLLIQDLGLYYILKQKHPDFELHCSTQMHIHNLEGVKTAKKLGFKRVVLARESDLELIKEACREDIEIEVFVHGAICTSYSGQCLMSAFTKDRSANKGMCAQCCRLRYDLLDDKGNKIKTDTDYLLSPKDMYLFDDIPDLIDAGVSSFKIEGRMKSSAYVGYVTSIYRKAIDTYLNEGRKYSLSGQESEDLKVLFNREFTNGLLIDVNDLYGQPTPNHLGIKIGDVINNKHEFTYIRLDKKLNQFDGIRINDFGCIVNMMYRDDLLVNSGLKGDIIAIKTDKKLNGAVYKTLDHVLEDKINSIPDTKIPLDMDIVIRPEENVSVRLKCEGYEYVYESQIIAQNALKSPISRDNIIKQFSKLNDTVYSLNSLNIEYEDSYLNLKDLNEIRREAVKQFDEYRLDSFSRNEIESQIRYQDLTDDVECNEIIQNGSAIHADNIDYLVNYVINPLSEYYDSEDSVISEAGGLLRPYRNKIAYYTLNCSNSYAYEFLKKLGFRHIILSTELNSQMIDHLIERYHERNSVTIIPCVFEKGRIPLMYLNNDPFMHYIDDEKGYILSDGMNKYAINKHGTVTELLSEEMSRVYTLDHEYIPFRIAD